MNEDRWWDWTTKAIVGQFVSIALGAIATVVTFQFGWAALVVGAAVTLVADGFIGHRWVLRLLSFIRKARAKRREQRAVELRAAAEAGRSRARSRQLERARDQHEAAMAERRSLPTAAFRQAMRDLEVIITNPEHDRGIVTIVNHSGTEMYDVTPRLSFFWRPDADWIRDGNVGTLSPGERSQFESRFEYEQFETSPAVTAHDEYRRLWERHQDGSIDMEDPEIRDFEPNHVFLPPADRQRLAPGDG